MTDLTGGSDRSKGQNEAEKSILERVWTALAMYKTASQQRISNYVSEREKVVSERASLDIAFRNYRADYDSRITRLQKTLKNKMTRAGEKASECMRLFVVENGLKAQLRHMAGDG